MKRLRYIVVIVAILAAGLLVLAWYDGGRQEQRLIVQPVEVPESYS